VLEDIKKSRRKMRRKNCRMKEKDGDFSSNNLQKNGNNVGRRRRRKW
jgi:hypothetical protein